VSTFYGELAEKGEAQQRFFNAVATAYPNDAEAQSPPTLFTPSNCITSLTAFEAGMITLYNGAAGCPVTNLGGIQYQNPWTFDPMQPTGQKWQYHPNEYNYLFKVIHDEFEGNLASKE
jgi:hypothetical protein